MTETPKVLLCESKLFAFGRANMDLELLSSEHLANAQGVDKLKGCLVSADSVCSERKTFKIASDTIQSTC